MKVKLNRQTEVPIAIKHLECCMILAILLELRQKHRFAYKRTNLLMRGIHKVLDKAELFAEGHNLHKMCAFLNSMVKENGMKYGLRTIHGRRLDDAEAQDVIMMSAMIVLRKVFHWKLNHIQKAFEDVQSRVVYMNQNYCFHEAVVISDEAKAALIGMGLAVPDVSTVHREQFDYRAIMIDELHQTGFGVEYINEILEGIEERVK